MSDLQDRLRFEFMVHRRAGLRRWPCRAMGQDAVDASDASAPLEPVELVDAAPEAEAAQTATAAATPTSGLAADQRTAALAALGDEVRACTRCGLCEQRNLAVPGEGALNPPILFIGEGPGADEDRTGRPFVGRAGQLLDRMIAAIGLRREQVYIANVVKCRPPGNRTPLPTEVQSCAPFLARQIELLEPKLICTLGLPSTRALLPSVTAISAVRGKEMVYQGIPLVPTFHPAYLLRKGRPAKVQAWSDMKLIARIALGKTID